MNVYRRLRPDMHPYQQYQDRTQIPAPGNDQDLPNWMLHPNQHMHLNMMAVGGIPTSAYNDFDYDSQPHKLMPNMQPMQRWFQGMDPSFVASTSGFHPVHFDGVVHSHIRTASPCEQQWPSLPYIPRHESPDRSSVSGTSSHACQSDRRSPMPPHPALYASPAEYSYAKQSYPSPELVGDGAYPSDLALAGCSGNSNINLRDLEIIHHEMEHMTEEHQHLDTDAEGEFEDDTIFSGIEIQVDEHQDYPTPGMSSGVRDAQSVEPMEGTTDESDSDYKPSSPRTRKRMPSATGRAPGRGVQIRRRRKSSITAGPQRATRITKKSRAKADSTRANCAMPSNSDLGRPFPCPFARYGCGSDFTSKNEWKRHVNTQHVKLGFWRCDLCPTTVDPRDDSAIYHNDFNRKDLFTQHLRRMHAAPPKQAPHDRKLYPVSEDNIREHQTRCWLKLRDTPTQSFCLFCPHAFRGPTSWEERMEHVGRHLEKDRDHVSLNPADWIEDPELERWLFEEGLIAHGRDGRLTLGSGTSRRSSEAGTETDEDA